MPEGPWITEEMFCGNCGNEWVAVHPACERVECSHCGHMAKTKFIECDHQFGGAHG